MGNVSSPIRGTAMLRRAAGLIAAVAGLCLVVQLSKSGSNTQRRAWGMGITTVLEDAAPETVSMIDESPEALSQHALEPEFLDGAAPPTEDLATKTQLWGSRR